MKAGLNAVLSVLGRPHDFIEWSRKLILIKLQRTAFSAIVTLIG
jgi:hypothetical protein